MNIYEMHMAFRTLLDKSSSLNYPDFEPEEIDEFLNWAQNRKVMTSLTGKSQNPLRKDSVEETEKRINDLRTLTEDYRVSPLPYDLNKNKRHGNFIVLPKHFLYMLDETIDATDIDCQGIATTYRDIEIKKTTHDKFSRMSKDQFNKPTIRRALKLPFGFYTYTALLPVDTATPIAVTTGIDQEYGPYMFIRGETRIGEFEVGDIIVAGTFSEPIVRMDYVTDDQGTYLFFWHGTIIPNDITEIDSVLRNMEVTSEVEEIIFNVNGVINTYKLRYIRAPRALSSDLYDETNPSLKIIDSIIDDNGNIIPSNTAYNTNVCELPEQTHYEIVDEAIAIALEVIESKRYQTNNNEYNKVS